MCASRDLRAGALPPGLCEWRCSCRSSAIRCPPGCRLVMSHLLPRSPHHRLPLALLRRLLSSSSRRLLPRSGSALWMCTGCSSVGPRGALGCLGGASVVAPQASSYQALRSDQQRLHPTPPPRWNPSIWAHQFGESVLFRAPPERLCILKVQTFLTCRFGGRIRTWATSSRCSRPMLWRRPSR